MQNIDTSRHTKIYIGDTEYYWYVICMPRSDNNKKPVAYVERKHSTIKDLVRDPMLGTMYFTYGNTTLDIVAHECRHTEEAASLALCLDNEEMKARYIGKIIPKVYKWLNE